MKNEEIKLEKDLKSLENEMKYLKTRIKEKKEEIKNHKKSINFKKIRCYLNKKLNTMTHGRQKNQCKKMISKLSYDNIETRNPQYYYILQAQRINNNINNNLNIDNIINIINNIN